jgi:hypothetical protein
MVLHPLEDHHAAAIAPTDLRFKDLEQMRYAELFNLQFHERLRGELERALHLADADEAQRWIGGHVRNGLLGKEV